MKSLTLKKNIADALASRRKYILAVRSFKYKKGCKEWQDLTDIADLLYELEGCFLDCESFSMDFVYPNGGKIHV